MKCTKNTLFDKKYAHRFRCASFFKLRSADFAALEALGANVNAFRCAVFFNDPHFLNVHSPTFSVFTVGVAHFITAELSFIAYAAYPRHSFTSVYVADI